MLRLRFVAVAAAAASILLAGCMAGIPHEDTSVPWKEAGLYAQLAVPPAGHQAETIRSQYSLGSLDIPATRGWDDPAFVSIHDHKDFSLSATDWDADGGPDFVLTGAYYPAWGIPQSDLDGFRHFLRLVLDPSEDEEAQLVASYLASFNKTRWERGTVFLDDVSFNLTTLSPPCDVIHEGSPDCSIGTLRLQFQPPHRGMLVKEGPSRFTLMVYPDDRTLFKHEGNSNLPDAALTARLAEFMTPLGRQAPANLTYDHYAPTIA